MHQRASLIVALLAIALVLPACSASTLSGRSESAIGALPASRQRTAAIGSYIQHVVIVVQENRSFDNIFAGFPGADAPTYGYAHDGSLVPLRPITFSGQDLQHGWQMAINNWNKGSMNGFDLNEYGSTAGGPSAGTYPYAYIERSLVAPYWAMARQYVLADHMFPTEMGGSFTAHIDLIAGTSYLNSPSLAEVDAPTTTPWGCDAPAGTTTATLNTLQHWSNTGPFPCFASTPSGSATIGTMAPLLDAANVSWKYYAPSYSSTASGGAFWSEFDAIHDVRYGADWKNVVLQTNVLSDVAGGTLPSVSWVIPDAQDSDHAGISGDTGPSWVASVVNAVGKSKYWNSTAIVVLWDDWGGWYDDVPPPQLDFVGLGIRVPCIIISPYAKPHYVSHTQYEFGSVLKFVEQTFGTPSLSSLGYGYGYTDARANSIVDSFDFTQSPRAFTSIVQPYSQLTLRKRKPSHRAPDSE